MERSQKQHIVRALDDGMVLLLGPKSVGKKTLALQIVQSFSQVVILDYNRFTDRRIIKEYKWGPSTECLIIEELDIILHWDTYLKALHEYRKKNNIKIIITSSINLNHFPSILHSIASFIEIHRVLPWSIAEGKQQQVQVSLNGIMCHGGFPEPLLLSQEERAQEKINHWRNQYIQTRIAKDIFDIETIHNICAFMQVYEYIRRSVGKKISFQHIAEEINISPTTVKKYIQLLESLWIIFILTPYSKGISRSILKEPKIYFYDSGLVEGDESEKLENVAGVALLKHIYAKQDCWKEPYQLHYLRTKEGKEIDFVITLRDTMKQMIDVCNSSKLHKHILYFYKKYNIPSVQLVTSNVIYSGGEKFKKENQDKAIIKDALSFLSQLYM